jgi:hypothetical protein
MIFNLIVIKPWFDFQYEGNKTVPYMGNLIQDTICLNKMPVPIIKITAHKTVLFMRFCFSIS